MQFKMDAVVEGQCDIKLLRQNPVLYVHCIDQSTPFQLTVAGFPILKLKCVYGHVSFLKDLSERRLVALPDSNVLLKFRGSRSPCCIYVKSSAIFDVSISYYL